MLNEIVLIGRLTKDIELKQTNSGLSVAQFVLAVERSFKNNNGERDADFISCVIWRKAAENLSSFSHKGSLIAVRGRLSTRSYEKDGSRVYVTEVVVEDFYLLESKKSSQQHNNSSNAKTNDSSKSPSSTNAGNQTAKQQSTNSTVQKNTPDESDNTSSSKAAIADLFDDSTSIDVSDNDLPF